MDEREQASREVYRRHKEHLAERADSYVKEREKGREKGRVWLFIFVIKIYILEKKSQLKSMLPLVKKLEKYVILIII